MLLAKKTLFLSFLIVVISGIKLSSYPVEIKILHENNSNGVPTLLGDTVTVYGKVTVPTGIFNNYSTNVYIQDSTGGIAIYKNDQSIIFSENDSVEVTGEVSQYNGLTEIQIESATIISNGSPAIPLVINTDDVSHCFQSDYTEPLEGRLVKLNNVMYTGIWPQSGSAGVLTIDDGSGATKLYINKYTEIPGSTPPDGPFDIVGVISQFDNNLPFDYHYEVTPRYLSDLTYHNNRLAINNGPAVCLLSDSSVTIDWETTSPGNSIVTYGIGSNITDTIVIDSFSTRHTVKLPNLSPLTIYSYRVISSNTTNSISSELFSFKTNSHSLISFCFITLADSRATNQNSPLPDAFREILFRMEKFHPELILFGGDAIFGSDDSLRLLAQWDEWKMLFNRTAHRIPIYPVIGNHEANCYYQNYDGGKVFAQEFVLPQNGPSGFKELAYSFDYGNAHFSILDSDVYNDQSRINLFQRQWLETDLLSTDRTHKFSFQHEEAYPPTSGTGRSLENYPQDRDDYWHILYQNNVEADICGHIHLWNRDFFGRTLPDTVTEVKQIINGTCGAPIVHGYGGDFYHFVVWHINADSVHFDVYNEKGMLMDSLSYTVAGVKEVAENNHYKNVFSILTPFTKKELKVRWITKNTSRVIFYIYNVNGSLVKEKDLGIKKTGQYVTKINISKLSQGVYFLKMAKLARTAKFINIR
ncbi:MAG: hypothetical protein B5M53_00840 [Candidatus Cloacimonas sp. 4484_209]|nr:MAG: hypothetical protein B5M53_00840 [Candidatus Cloacimonas sp. 4484_209]